MTRPAGSRRCCPGASARFCDLSDAIDPTKTLAYGKLWKFGPSSCRARITGVRCRNAANHGWFVSKTSYKRF